MKPLIIFDWLIWQKKNDHSPQTFGQFNRQETHKHNHKQISMISYFRWLEFVIGLQFFENNINVRAIRPELKQM